MKIESKVAEVEKVIKVKEKVYDIQFSEQEIRLLMSYVSHTTGQDVGPRGLSNEIYYKLQKLGIVEYVSRGQINFLGTER